MNTIDGSKIILRAIYEFVVKLLFPESCNYIFNKGGQVKHFCILKRGHRGAHVDMKL